MSRALCQECQRPTKACICKFAVSIENDISVIILQHPSEVGQSKGTVSLLKQSLTKCEVIVGENFDDSAVLSLRLKHYADKTALLYPSEQASLLDYLALKPATLNIDNYVESDVESDVESEVKSTVKCGVEDESTKTLTNGVLADIECIIILDGTWKKAYRMFMLNPCLQQIKHIVLPQGITSLYQIRKTKKDNALSSLEACCHALARLENAPEKYQNLLSSFVKFNEFQQSFNQSTH